MLHSISSDQYSKGFVLVLVSALCYGLQPFFAYFAYADGADPIGLLVARFSLASGIMLLWLKKSPVSLPGAGQFFRTMLIGVGYAGAAIGYYNASHSVSFSLAIILMFSFPAFVTLFSILFLREALCWKKMCSLILASGGVVLATGMSFKGDLNGVLWALFAALSYGAAILYGTHKVPSSGSLISAAIILLGGMLTVLCVSLFQGVTWPQTIVGWSAVAGLALFATILPIATFICGSPHIGASRASTLSTLEPLVAITIAVLLIGESLSSTMLIGGVLVVIAAVLLASNGERKSA